MLSCTWLFIINLGFSLCGNSPTHFAQTEVLDTIPKGKMILYKGDSNLHQLRGPLYLDNLSKLMGLNSLQGSSHKLLIRIWLWDFGEHYVIDISKESSHNSSSVLSWHSKRIDSNTYIVPDKQWPALEPKSGWDQFFNTLDKYQIRKMNSGLSFEMHDRHLTQSSYVQFEIMEKGNYRFYEYLEPSYYRFVERGSNNVYRFLKYFDQEMGVDLYMPPENLYERKK